MVLELSLIKQISHIEFYVTNICQALLFHHKILGFTPIAYSGLETGSKSKVQYFISQGYTNLILTSAVNNNDQILQYLSHHGDGVRDIAFIVDNVESVFRKALDNGAKVVAYPQTIQSHTATIFMAQIAVFGDVIHTLIASTNSNIPDFTNLADCKINNSVALETKLFNKIDHIAICVNSGELNYWTQFYINVFDLRYTSEENIDTGKSGMNSKVLQSENGEIKLVLTEPLSKYENSQIKTFIKYNNGPGVQHLAFQTSDIITTVNSLHEMIDFLQIPDSYYKIQLTNFPKLAEKINRLQSLNILIDQNNEGYLYQCFSKPIQTRPTYFFEIIQREGAHGFGSDNIKMLFKAIEIELDIYDKK